MYIFTYSKTNKKQIPFKISLIGRKQFISFNLGLIPVNNNNTSVVSYILFWLFLLSCVEAFYSLSAVSACIPLIPAEEVEEAGKVFGTILSYLMQLRDSEGEDNLYLFEWWDIYLLWFLRKPSSDDDSVQQ